MTHIPYLTSTIGPAHDRRTRLLVLGILLLTLGGFCLLITLATTSILLLRPGGMPAVPWQRVIMQLLIYCGAATVFATLGFGSIYRKRWVRPVVLGIAWPWLIAGICGTGMVAFMMRRMSGALGGAGTAPGAAPGAAPGIPPAAQTLVLVIGVAFSALIYIGFPLALILSFQSPQVQSTLDFYDPHPRWTDGVPIRVLSLCTLMLVSSLGILANTVVAVMPFFGILLTGIPAIAVMLAIAAFFLLAAWWNYHLQMRGWILSLVLFIVPAISAAITFSRISMTDFYKAMGSSDSEIEMMRQMNLARSGLQMLLWVGFGAGIGVGYLLFVRRCFISKPPPVEPLTAPPALPEGIV